MRVECHGLTRPLRISGSSSRTEKKARKNAVCTLSIWSESSRIITPLRVKMKPPLTSQSAPRTLGGRPRSWATASRTSGSQRALHQHAVEPAAELEADVLEPADHAEATGRMEPDRWRRA